MNTIRGEKSCLIIQAKAHADTDTVKAVVVSCTAKAAVHPQNQSPSLEIIRIYSYCFCAMEKQRSTISIFDLTKEKQMCIIFQSLSFCLGKTYALACWIHRYDTFYTLDVALEYSGKVSLRIGHQQ